MIQKLATALGAGNALSYTQELRADPRSVARRLLTLAGTTPEAEGLREEDEVLR